MRPEFDGIYRDTLELYTLSTLSVPPGTPFPRPLDAMRLVRTAVERSERELPREMALRPDARLFLTVNLHQMVVMPLLHENAGPSVFPFSGGELWGELQAMLTEDARTILGIAARDAFAEPPPDVYHSEGRPIELSSGAILRAVAASWGKLRLDRFEIWG